MSQVLKREPLNPWNFPNDRSVPGTPGGSPDHTRADVIKVAHGRHLDSFRVGVAVLDRPVT